MPASAPNWSGRPQVATRKVRSGCYRKGQPKYQNTRAPQRTSRAALRLQPLRRGEVAVLCGGGTGILIPRTALRLQPLQRGEVRQRKRERVGGGSRKAWLCLEVWVWVGGSGRGVMEGCSVLPGARACWTIGHGEDRRRLPCEPSTAEGGAARRPTHPRYDPPPHPPRPLFFPPSPPASLPPWLSLSLLFFSVFLPSLRARWRKLRAL